MSWLENEDARLRVESWSLSTCLDELVDDGVQVWQIFDVFFCVSFFFGNIGSAQQFDDKEIRFPKKFPESSGVKKAQL